MITFSLFHTVPAMASPNLIGSLDIFDGKQLSGWMYDPADHSATPEVHILISNATTGEPVEMITTKTEYKRNVPLTGIPTDTSLGFLTSFDTSSLPDGSYGAAAYKNGQKFSNTVYYVKGNAANGLNGKNIKSLGQYRLTAYCPCRSCSEGWGSHTSSGAIAASSHTVAVDPRVIPIGSKLLINGVVYTAEDIGGAVKGNHIDIYFDTHSQTREFGSRFAEVFLIQ